MSNVNSRELVYKVVKKVQVKVKEKDHEIKKECIWEMIKEKKHVIRIFIIKREFSSLNKESDIHFSLFLK